MLRPDPTDVMAVRALHAKYRGVEIFLEGIQAARARRIRRQAWPKRPK